MNTAAKSIADPVYSEFAHEPDFRELLETFASAVPERRQGLRDASLAQDWETLRTRAHQLKGAGGGFGFPVVTELAAELEQACKAGQSDRITATLEALLAYLGRIAV